MMNMMMTDDYDDDYDDNHDGDKEKHAFIFAFDVNVANSTPPQIIPPWILINSSCHVGGERRSRDGRQRRS